MKFFLFLLFIVLSFDLTAQSEYSRIIKLHRQEYLMKHEVVKEPDKKYFRFFPANNQFKIQAEFKRIIDTIGFLMKTSGTKTPRYFRYGQLSFKLYGKDFHLTVYQGEQTKSTDEYKDYLFVPYTDLTSGNESYGGGKYLDINIGDIVSNRVWLDFNRAYNPYCAYTSGYNCPVPPRENFLAIKIKAGEKNFKKPLK